MNRTVPATLTNACVLCDDCGRFLMIEKTARDGRKGWYFPGGHVEKDESLTESVIREVKEETGLTVHNPRLFCVKDWIEKDRSRYFVFLYACSDFSGTVRESSEGRLFWVDQKTLKEGEPFWHMDQTLEILESNEFRELFFDALDNAKPRIL